MVSKPTPNSATLRAPRTKVSKSIDITTNPTVPASTPAPNILPRLQDRPHDILVMAADSRETVQPQQKKKKKVMAQAPGTVVLGKTSESLPLPQQRRVATQDKKLHSLFSKTVQPTKITVTYGPQSKSAPKLDPPVEIEVSQEDMDRFKANRGSNDTLSFKRKGGDACRGHPSRAVLRRDCAAAHSTFLRNALTKDPHIKTVEYGNEIEEGTVHRFVACISPSLRSNLPTHDLTETSQEGGRNLVSTQIQWTMQELQDLYMLAHCMGAHHVCDMIIDRWHEELNRPINRVLHTELGSLDTFDILSFDPAFVNYLAQHDIKAAHFLSDVLIREGNDGWNFLEACGLGSWSADVKAILIETMESGSGLPASMPDPKTVCQAYHHHNGGECYKSQAATVDLDMGSPTAQVVPSASPNRPNSRAMSEAQAKRWAIQRAFQEKEREKNNKRKRQSDFDGDERIQKKLREYYEEDDTDAQKLFEESDDSEEESNAVTFELPDDYSHGPRSSNSDDEDSEDFDFIPYKNTVVRDAGPGRIWYPGKGMNGIKDGKEVALRKMEMVKEKLALFQAAGYNIDDIPIEVSEDEDEEDDSEEEEDIENII